MSKSNPRNLKIGQVIKTPVTCYVAYDDKGNRRLHRTHCSSPLIVVGTTIKCTGKYIPESISYDYGEDYCPPYLQVDKRILLYECRKNLSSPIVLVHPEDILSSEPTRSMVVNFRDDYLAMIQYDEHTSPSEVFDWYIEFGGWSRDDLSYCVVRPLDYPERK